MTHTLVGGVARRFVISTFGMAWLGAGDGAGMVWYGMAWCITA